MAFDDKENHTVQELIEYLSVAQLDVLFPIFFDPYMMERVITHPRANHVVQKYMKRLGPFALTRALLVLSSDPRQMNRLACGAIGNNVYQTGIKLSDVDQLNTFCKVLLVDDIILKMARNQFGLCVIRCLFQQILAKQEPPPYYLQLKTCIFQNWNDLCFLKYGNLTAQFLISSCMDNDDFEQFDLFNIVRTMSKHPHANHVVQTLCQRCALHGTNEQKLQMINATAMYFVQMATSQYGAFVCECVLKHFSTLSTLPLLNMLCDVGDKDDLHLSESQRKCLGYSSPTNLCLIAMTQYGTQFLQKFVDIADDVQLEKLDQILADDLVDIMMCELSFGLTCTFNVLLKY